MIQPNLVGYGNEILVLVHEDDGLLLLPQKLDHIAQGSGAFAVPHHQPVIAGPSHLQVLRGEISAAASLGFRDDPLYWPFGDVVPRCVPRAVHGHLACLIPLKAFLDRRIGAIGVSDDDIEVRRHDLFDPLLHLIVQAFDGNRSGDEDSRHSLFPR